MDTKREQKFLNHADFFKTTPICVHFLELFICNLVQIEQFCQGIVKVSQSMSQLARIFVFEELFLLQFGYHRSQNFYRLKIFVDDLFQQKLNTWNILHNVHRPIPIWSLKSGDKI